MKKINKSFKEWCIENDRKDILDLWDYELNEFLPSEISYCYTGKVYFKCPKGRHDSFQKKIYHFSDGGVKNIHCDKCESFAQYVIDTKGEDYLKTIWSNKNNKTPWDYKKSSKQKVWFICEKDSTHIYDRTICKQSAGQKCPYCLNRKIGDNNSLGYQYPESIKYWGSNNNLSPYKYVPGSNRKAWWKCQNNKHKEYYRSIYESVKREFRCPECSNHPERAYNFIDLTGKMFGELFVVGIDEQKTKESNVTYWICKCSCGNTTSIRSSCLNCKGQKTCGNRSVHQSGDGNPNWKGGVSSTNNRKTQEYIRWREKSLELDNYVCQCCLKRGGNLNVHHIYSYANYEDLRTDLNNSIVLCELCHGISYPDSLHGKYGVNDVTPKQLDEFINKKRKQLGIIVPFNIENYIRTKNTTKFNNWINFINSDPEYEEFEEPLDKEE